MHQPSSQRRNTADASRVALAFVRAEAKQLAASLNNNDSNSTPGWDRFALSD